MPECGVDRFCRLKHLDPSRVCVLSDNLQCTMLPDFGIMLHIVSRPGCYKSVCVPVANKPGKYLTANRPKLLLIDNTLLYLIDDQCRYRLRLDCLSPVHQRGLIKTATAPC